MLLNNLVKLIKLLAVIVAHHRLKSKLGLKNCNLCVPGGKLRTDRHVCGWGFELSFEGIRYFGVGWSGFGSYRDPRKMSECELNVLDVFGEHMKSAESPRYTVRAQLSRCISIVEIRTAYVETL
jgi:hypothetical protein